MSSREEVTSNDIVSAFEGIKEESCNLYIKVRRTSAVFVNIPRYYLDTRMPLRLNGTISEICASLMDMFLLLYGLHQIHEYLNPNYSL